MKRMIERSAVLILVILSSLAFTSVRARADSIEKPWEPWESAGFDGQIRAIAVDDDRVYAAGGPDGWIRSYDRDDGTLDWETDHYGGYVYAIDVDSSHVYAAGDAGLIRAYDRDDGSFEFESPSYGGTIFALEVGSDYVYAGGADTDRVVAYDVLDLDYAWQAADYGNTIEAIVKDGTMLYAAGRTSVVESYHPNTGDTIWTSEPYDCDSVDPPFIESLAVGGGNVYAAGDTCDVVFSYDRSDGSKLWESADYGGTIYALAADDDLVYAGGESPDRVVAYGEDGTEAWRSETQYDDGSNSRVHAVTLYDDTLYVGGYIYLEDATVRTLDATFEYHLVSYEPNGGSSVDFELVEDGELATEPTDPTRTGYAFDGWYTDDGTFSDAWDFDTDTVTDDVTLYAKWDIETYTVSYDSNGGTSVDSEDVEYDGLATEPPDPTRAGYDFVDWYTDESTWVDRWRFYSDRVTEDLTLYARWSTETHEVTFDADGGTATPSQTVVDGELAERPPDPLKDDHVFVGWYRNRSKTREWNFNVDEVENDVTLYAKWRPELEHGFEEFMDDAGIWTPFGRTLVGGLFMALVAVFMAVLGAPSQIVVFTATLAFVVTIAFGLFPAWIGVLLAILLFAFAFMSFRGGANSA